MIPAAHRAKIRRELETEALASARRARAARSNKGSRGRPGDAELEPDDHAGGGHPPKTAPAEDVEPPGP